MQMRLTCIALAITAFSAQSNTENIYPLQKINVTLANEYSTAAVLSHYWVSEKLDGIRAIWDGSILKTRGGKEIYAPSWFTAALPSFPVEGELWAGRGKFTQVHTTVLDHNPSEAAWQTIRLMLFDLPNSIGSYQQRYAKLSQFIENNSNPHIDVIEQNAITTESELLAKLASVTAEGGEGLMLRHIENAYQGGRSDDLLKLKQYQDAEAIVVGYKTGTGKYKNQVGSLLVKIASGLEFYIGSGLSDAQRQSPPPLGSSITFRYNGLTSNGIPRFARYIRQRNSIEN